MIEVCVSDYWLRDGVYCGEAGEAFIFLDLRADRYLALSQDIGYPLKQVVYAQDSPRQTPGYLRGDDEGRALLAALTERDLLTTNPHHRNRATVEYSVATSTIDCVDSAQEFKLSGALCLRFFLSYWTLAPLQRWTSLKQSIERLRRRKASIQHVESEPSDKQLRNLVGHFMRLRAITYTSRNCCVLDSLVLFDFLLRNGVCPTFLLGVAMRPFRAHCWVQYKSIALNDTFEFVDALSPLVVV
jgi:hypothetical protein